MRKIVLTTDLSPESESAFPVAIEFARKFDVPIALVHVVIDPELAPALTTDYGAADAAERRLAEMRSRMPQDVQITVHVLAAEDAPTAIADYAGKNADLIVLSTHGHTGFRRLVIGSTAAEILCRSVVPVMCVPLRKAG